MVQYVESDLDDFSMQRPDFFVCFPSGEHAQMGVV